MSFLRSIMALALSFLLTWSVVIYLKELIGRARPMGALVDVTGYSFPSAHAAVSAAFFACAALILVPMMKEKRDKWLIAVLCVIAALVIGLSRVYLNVHWLTDVIAGWGIGILIGVGSWKLVIKR